MKAARTMKKRFSVKLENSTKISTYLALTTSVLVVAATLGVAIYSLFFINNLFTFLIPHGEFYYQLNIFKDSLQRIVFAFLVFGLIASYYLTKVIISPLEELVKGTKELSKGNLEYRFNKSRYLEINELIKTYNQMAENLDSLYKDLEKKVQERTMELEVSNKELKSTQAMMVHSEKMRSLGQLVAGITHEINNPINFIHGNLSHLKNYSAALVQLIEAYEDVEMELSSEKLAEIIVLKEKIELDFIKEDMPQLIRSCHEGTERTKDIILDLKNFSRLDEMVVGSIDLPKEIDTTLHILQNKIKHRIEVIKEYEDELPKIEGFGGQLNQVFMNIIDNACYAIKEGGKIYIRLNKTEKDVIIEFEDTGSGMGDEQMKKIFEPFYTTKPVGEGTGLGMSISYKVIQNHNGTIEIKSEMGKGTCFKITLPIKMEQSKEVRI